MDFDSVVWAPVYPGSEALRACFGRVCVIARTDDGGWYFSTDTNPDEDED